MSEHVMLDLETMGLLPDAAIIEIGAVKFDPEKGTISGEFNETVSLSTSVELGMKISPSTVMWWMSQSDDARRKVSRGGSPITEVLERFNQWFGDDKPVWGNGAAFDNVVIESAFRLVGMKLPWTYRSNRCYRTMRAQALDIEYRQVGTAHCALDDARSQAVHLIKIFDSMLKPRG